MKICIIICGLKRCIDLVINNLDNVLCEHEIQYITCLSNDTNHTNNQIDKDINKPDLTILDKPNIIKKIFFLNKNKIDEIRIKTLKIYNKFYKKEKLINNLINSIIESK